MGKIISIFALTLFGLSAHAQYKVRPDGSIEQLGEMSMRYRPLTKMSVDTQVAAKLLTTCGATFKGAQARKIEQMSAFSGDDDFKPVDVNALSRRIALLKDCSGVQRSGSFFICKKGSTYSYFNASFEKISSQPCDQVVTEGSSIFCMNKEESGYEVVQSHRSNSAGRATCTQALMFSPDKNSNRSVR